MNTYYHVTRRSRRPKTTPCHSQLKRLVVKLQEKLSQSTPLKVKAVVPPTAPRPEVTLPRTPPKSSPENWPGTKNTKTYAGIHQAKLSTAGKMNKTNKMNAGKTHTTPARRMPLATLPQTRA